MGSPASRGTESSAPTAALAGVLAALALSLACLAIAPALMPDSYSWTANTTSESAAQGVDGAWLARLGFLLFGFGVISLAAVAAPRWGWWGTALQLAFGAFMIATAAFATRSWEQRAEFDSTEDALHSVASAGVGFSFALGVLAVSLNRGRAPLRARAPDLVAIAAAVVLPLCMSAWDDAAGILQRALFAIAYAWYAAEAVRLRS